MLKLLTYKTFLSVEKLGQTQRTKVLSAIEEAILLFRIIVKYICGIEQQVAFLDITDTRSGEGNIHHLQRH